MWEQQLPLSVFEEAKRGQVPVAAADTIGASFQEAAGLVKHLAAGLPLALRSSPAPHRSNFERSFLDDIYEKIASNIVYRAQLDEIRLFVHSKLWDSFTFCD